LCGRGGEEEEEEGEEVIYLVSDFFEISLNTFPEMKLKTAVEASNVTKVK
jgi:hypothetical protein